MEYIQDFYKEIFKLIDKEKLKSSKNLPKLDSSVGYHGADMVSSEKYPWVKEIYLRFKEMAPKLIEPYLHSKSPRIFYEKPYSTGYTFNSIFDWTITDPIFSLRANYSCLFPSRIIYLSYQFKYWEAGYWSPTSDDEFCIPLDFFAQLFALKSALTNRLTLLLPQRISKRDVETDSNFEYWGTFKHRNESGTINLEANGLGYESLSKYQSEHKISPIEPQLVRTPWLLGAKLDDFVNLVNKHPDEFFLYSNAFSRFFKEKSEPQEADVIVEWLDELAVATKQLDVIFKKKRRELTRNGVDVAVGTICTVATLFLPDAYAPVKTLMASLFGSKTTYEALSWVRDFINAKDELSDDKNWILWRSIK